MADSNSATSDLTKVTTAYEYTRIQAVQNIILVWLDKDYDENNEVGL